MKTFAVVTTIQQPTACMRALSKCLVENDIQAMIIGDGKGPASFELEGCEFFSLETQRKLDFQLQPLLPTGHYARKNLGYLLCMKQGAKRIFETDDDNAPTADWKLRSEFIEQDQALDQVERGNVAVSSSSSSSQEAAWCNVYHVFSPAFGSGVNQGGEGEGTGESLIAQALLRGGVESKHIGAEGSEGCKKCDALIWPRGLPLDRVRDKEPIVTPVSSSSSSGWNRRCPIQQGLADGAPDVDAIWRLLVDCDYRFVSRSPLILREGVWCPFNSQNTWWFPVAFPLMYLPSFCSFRMTDIWRSFVAQRCLWALGGGVEFHSADVVQDRNAHNLMRDFTDEIPGYTKNASLCSTLLKINSLQSGEENVGANLLECYSVLVREGFFPEKELDLVRAWLADVSTVLASN